MPTYLDMVQSNGRTLRFSASTGKVVSIISASGVETTAENYSRQMKVNRHPSTGAIQSIWSKSQGLLQAVGEGNRLTLEWYAPGQVSRNGRSFAGTGTPYKTVSYERSSDQGVQVLDIAEQREGMPVFRTQRRTEGNKVTTIQGEGEERTVRTVEKNVLPEGKWEMIKSIQGINEEMPFSCMRTVKKYTDGGWLTVSSTRGYNTPLAQTTLYTYNDQFRVSWRSSPMEGTHATSTTSRDGWCCKPLPGRVEVKRGRAPLTPTCALTTLDPPRKPKWSLPKMELKRNSANGLIPMKRPPNTGPSTR